MPLLSSSFPISANLEWLLTRLKEHDPGSDGHAVRVAKLTLNMARIIGISWDELSACYTGALLHDIGKLVVPQAILHSRHEKLEDYEWQIMRLHPIFGKTIVSAIDIDASAQYGPYLHHERWDGHGYPLGLRQMEIPLLPRMVAIADVWDALLANRPYKEGWAPEQAIHYIRSQAGKQFDPNLVEVFEQGIEGTQWSGYI